MPEQYIEKIVFNHKPQLKKFIEQNDHLSLFEYYSSLTSLKNTYFNQDRQKELLTIIKEKITVLYGAKIAISATEHLAHDYRVSTAEHHGIVCHPFFLNNTICQFLVQPSGRKNYSVVLTCGSISLNNSSFPRGLLLHNKKLEEARLHFFSGRYKHQSVFSLKPYAKKQLMVMKHEINKIGLSTKIYQKLEAILENNVFSSDVLDQPCFSDQVSRLNQILWKLIPGQENNELIHLEQEEIVRQLIIRFHLSSTSIIHKIIFNKKVRSLFIIYFEKVVGAFNTTTQQGTVLFWGLDKSRRISLWYKDNFLVSSDESFKIALEPDIICQYLENKTLMPSMALSFIVLSFFYGLICSGGFSQINYLPSMLEAYKKLLQGAGYTEEYNLVLALPTSIFSGEFVLSTISDHYKVIPALSLDMILYGDSTLSERLTKLSHTITMKEVIGAMMPEYYKIITGQAIAKVDTKLPKPSLYV